jgi:hypothetical protein
LSSSACREDGDVSNGNGASRRNHINQQTFRKVPASYPANRTLGNGPAEWPPGGGSSEDAARAAALAAAEAAAETARKLEAEKLRIQMEAKKREEELMNTIRQQQLQLQRFQQAAALAEQKAKVLLHTAQSIHIIHHRRMIDDVSSYFWLLLSLRVRHSLRNLKTFR